VRALLKGTREAKGLADRGENEGGIGQRCERYPNDSVGKRLEDVGGDLQRESCFSGTARAGDGDDPRAVGEQRGELGKFALPTYQR
jgi:hypothetical protein